MVLHGDETQVDARFDLLRDRCTVCAERTIGSEVVLDTPDGTLR